MITPWDLEQEYGLGEGNNFQGELSLEQLLFQRPAAGWSRYHTLIKDLWMWVRDPSGRRHHGRFGPARRGGAARVEVAMSKKHDVLVIGAGHNGSTAAAFLPQKGRKVMVVERREVAGGLAAGHEFHPDYSTGVLRTPSGVHRWVVEGLGLEKHSQDLPSASSAECSSFVAAVAPLRPTEYHDIDLLPTAVLPIVGRDPLYRLERDDANGREVALGARGFTIVGRLRALRAVSS